MNRLVIVSMVCLLFFSNSCAMFKKKSTQEKFFDKKIKSRFVEVFDIDGDGKLTWDGVQKVIDMDGDGKVTIGGIIKVFDDLWKDGYPDLAEEKIKKLIGEKTKDFCKKLDLIVENSGSEEGKNFWDGIKSIYEKGISDYIGELKSYKSVAKALTARAKDKLSTFLAEKHKDIFAGLGIGDDTLKELSSDAKFYVSTMIENYDAVSKGDFADITKDLAKRFKVLDTLNGDLDKIIGKLKRSDKKDAADVLTVMQGKIAEQLNTIKGDYDEQIAGLLQKDCGAGFATCLAAFKK